ncbi:MAG: HAD family hydrolase [Oscillospiraceae bacterium]
MGYAALVLDIDGTLVCPERPRPSAACIAALGGLQARGVAVMVATGRGPFLCTTQLLGGFVPDYRVCANGAYVMDAAGRTVYQNRFTEEQFHGLVAYARSTGHRLSFTYEDAYHVYSDSDEYLLRFDARPRPVAHVKDGAHTQPQLSAMPFGAFYIMPPEHSAAARAANGGLKMLQSFPGGFDVCKTEMGKAVGVDALLQQLGLEWRDVVAVGDSENDLEILQAAGLGIAMGNAPEGVKQAADAVTASVQEDGVLQVIEAYF